MANSLGDDNIVEEGATDSQIDKQAKKCPDDDYREESQLCGTCIVGNGILIHSKIYKHLRTNDCRITKINESQVFDKKSI